MTEHTAEPLYALPFPSGTAAQRFLDAIRAALVSREVSRRTPPGPLVIYGPAILDASTQATLFVTRGVLRAAEIVGLPWPDWYAVPDGAAAIPGDTVTHFAMIGGE